MKKRIYLSPPHLGGKELDYIKEVFDSNWIAPVGPHIDKFEKKLAQYLNVKAVAALSSGTAALHLALILADVQPGDEVIVSTFTFVASVNPILYQRSIPVLVDSEKDTWNISPELIEYAIKDRIKRGKKPKAIIVVHLFGMPAKMDQILQIAKKYEITVIEDAAEALGSAYKGKKCGTFGKIGIFSFNGNKILNTSGGGALVSDNTELVQKAKFLATQAKDPLPYYHHTHLGYNYRLSNVLAAIGLGQLEVLEDRIDQKRKILQFYRQEFKDIEGIKFLLEPNADFYSNYWLTAILIDPQKAGFSNHQLLEAFERQNIEARYLWKPMHQQPLYKDAPSYLNGVSDELFAKGLCLPSGTGMDQEDFERISSVIKSMTQ